MYISLLTFAVRSICYTEASLTSATCIFLYYISWVFFCWLLHFNPCNINQENSSLDVICCRVAFNNDKIKMYPKLKHPLFKVGIMS